MKRMFLAWAVLLPMICRSGDTEASAWTWADRPYEGSWVVVPALTTFQSELGMRAPNFSLEGGTFRRTDCRGEPIALPADGSEHDVRGQPLYDAMSVRVLDARRVEIVQKSAGKIVWKGSYKLAKNTNEMTLEFEDDRAAKPVSGTLFYVRGRDGVWGAHALSGTWHPRALTRLSQTGMVLTIATAKPDTAKEQNGNDPTVAFSLTESDGRSADGKIDAQSYALQGYLAGAQISLIRAIPDMLQINRYQNRELVELSRATVAEDGRTMTLTQTDWICLSKTIFTLRKTS